MRLAILLIILAIAAVAASMDMPTASGSIPPLGAIKPELKTACDEYIATPYTTRIDQWINTFQSGLMKNPELEQDVWTCVMDLYKMSETDQFMLSECRINTNTPFNDLAFKALSVHLDKCGIGVSRD
jgi:hypothetical protein